MIFGRKKPSVFFLWHRIKPELEARWKEDDHQSYICTKLDDWLQDYADAGQEPPFLYESSLEGVKLTIRQAIKAKYLGMKSGVPDLRFYLPSGILLSIELKRWGGTLSKAQKQRHEQLRKKGFIVIVVKEKTPWLAWQRVLAILRDVGV